MSSSRPVQPVWKRPAIVFGAALALMSLTLLFGIAVRVSLAEDNDVVARAGISRVLTGGFPDFRDTTFFIALVVAGYLGCLWALRRGFRNDFAAAIAGTLIAGAAMLPAMPLTSPDAVHFAADVRTFWIHGKWPAEFAGAPSTVDDPVADEVRVFREQPSGYGPLAYAIGGAPIPFVGDGFKANLLGQKVLAGIFLTATAAAAGIVAGRLGQSRALVAGMVGLNPMMIWQFFGDGHNDAMMAFFGVIALGLVMADKWAWRGGGVLTWLVSALCKYALVLASPVVAAWWWPKWRNPLAFITAAGGGFILLLYVIEAGPVVNGALGPAAAVIETTPWYWIADWTDSSRTGRSRIVLASYVLFFFVLGLTMMYHRLDTKLDLAAAVAFVMMFFLYAAPGYHPWYIIWYLPFAAMSGSRWLIAAALTFSLCAFLPVLALNWRITLSESANVPNPVAWATAIMWFGTALAGYIGWRGRDWTSFGTSRSKKAAGPRFAPRQRKRAEA